MNKRDIQRHIYDKKVQKAVAEKFWARFEKLHSELNFSESTYNEIRVRNSSIIAQCDKSIQDHERLLTNPQHNQRD